MSENRNKINWYPGHMAKSRRILEDQLKGVDAVIELCDARAPMASRNPVLRELTKNKARLLILNKVDLASEAETQKWAARFQAEGEIAIKFNSNSGRPKEMLAAINRLVKPVVDRAAARGIKKTVRAMVIGIPNAGKSSFINRLNGQTIAVAADRPGVTRAVRWIKLGPYMELLDTPGMLPPRLDDQQAAETLAFIGSVRDGILDTEGLAERLLKKLMEIAPEAAEARFRLSKGQEEDCLLEAACRGRGWLLSGGRLDTERGAALVLDEFRAGKVGRITLEKA